MTLEAPFVVRLPGNRISATKYHLYVDCGHVELMLRGDWEPIPLEGELGRQLIDTLALTPCRTCVKRSEELSLEQILRTYECTPVRELLAALAEHGYEIRHKRTGWHTG